MSKYEGVECPICGKPFDKQDDLVVCPECGAPYHRACIAKRGSCVYADQHGPDFAWEEPNKQAEKEAQYDGKASLRCSRCGTVNPYGGLFCEVCGTPLHGNQQDNPFPGQGPYGQTPPPGFHSIPYNPFTTPFGGLGADEEIDGIPVKDLALFVGDNPHYFLPKFKEMKNHRATTWNWAAVFFQYFYFAYRKMWGFAILSFLACTVLEIPSFIYSAQAVIGQQVTPLFYTIMLVCSFLSVAVRVLLGLFANKLYMYAVFRRVRKIRAKYGDSPQYNEMLLKQGSVSRVAVIVLAAIYFVLSMAMTWFTIWLGAL